MAIGILLIFSVRTRLALKLFATISIAAYIAGMVGTWWPSHPFFPIASAVVILLSGWIVYVITRRHSADRSRVVAFISTIAIIISAVGFIAAFWFNSDLEFCFYCMSSGTHVPMFRSMPFALVVGSIVPLFPAVGPYMSWLSVNPSGR